MLPIELTNINRRLREKKKGKVMKKRERKTVPTIEYLTKTKEDAMLLLTMAEEAMNQLRLDIGVHKMVIGECDREVARQQQEKRDVKAAKGSARTRIMVYLVVVTILILVTIVCSSCQTLQGAKGDIHWLTADVEHSKQ